MVGFWLIPHEPRCVEAGPNSEVKATGPSPPPTSCLCTPPGDKRPSWRVALKKEAEPTGNKLHPSYTSPSGVLTTEAKGWAPAAHPGAEHLHLRTGRRRWDTHPMVRDQAVPGPLLKGLGNGGSSHGYSQVGRTARRVQRRWPDSQAAWPGIHFAACHLTAPRPITLPVLSAWPPASLQLPLWVSSTRSTKNRL